MKYIKIFFVIAALMVFISPIFTGAAGSTLPSPYNSVLGDPPDIFCFIEYVMTNIVLPLAAMVSVFFLIYTGYKFVWAQGEPKAIEEAKSMLKYTLIGIALLFGATAISILVQNTLGELLPGVSAVDAGCDPKKTL